MTPFYIQFHALKRLAERAPLEGSHVLALLELFRSVVCDCAPVAVLLAHAVDTGLIPAWTHLPIPSQDGVLLCEFGATNSTRGFPEDCWFITRHGSCFPQMGAEPAHSFVQANTFVTHGMLRADQRRIVGDFAEALSPKIGDINGFGPMLYGCGPEVLSNQDKHKFSNIAASVSENVSPKKFNAAF